MKLKFTQNAAANPLLSFFGALSRSGFGFPLCSARPLRVACLTLSHSETLESMQSQVILGYSHKPGSTSSASDACCPHVAPGEARRAVHVWTETKTTLLRLSCAGGGLVLMSQFAANERLERHLTHASHNEGHESNVEFFISYQPCPPVTFDTCHLFPVIHVH